LRATGKNTNVRKLTNDSFGNQVKRFTGQVWNRFFGIGSGLEIKGNLGRT